MYVARSEKRIFVTCLTRLENVYREEKRYTCSGRRPGNPGRCGNLPEKSGV